MLSLSKDILVDRAEGAEERALVSKGLFESILEFIFLIEGHSVSSGGPGRLKILQIRGTGNMRLPHLAAAGVASRIGGLEGAGLEELGEAFRGDFLVAALSRLSA